MTFLFITIFCGVNFCILSGLCNQPPSNILEIIIQLLSFKLINFVKTYIEMVFTNVYMTVLNFSWITSTSGMKPNTFIFSAGAGTLMKILLVESALLLGHNFVTHSLFRGIFFEILEFRFHRHSLTVTVQ
jgi:hypothetical protein